MNGFNKPGTIMFLAAFGVASAILYAASRSNEGLAMMIAGPVLSLVDLTYRRRRRGRLFGPTGGTFLYLPVWAWGLFWTALGACYFVRR